MNRERWLICYALAVGALGWSALLLSPPDASRWPELLAFIALALLIEGVGFRVPPADPQSMVGVVLLTAALALGPANGALVAGASGLVFGALLPLIYGRPRTFYSMVARPVLRGGVRILAVLAGAGLAWLAAGPRPGPIALLGGLLLSYPLITQAGRAVRELIQGGRSGLLSWWRSSWRTALSAEVAPLPVAALGAAVYTELGPAYFLLAAASLLGASIAVRRAAFTLRRQRRSVRELALLNETSRAIIRADLEVDALCELIYREASKVVDTSSFHLGLFEPGSDRYTLKVRVQDRVRLPPLTVDLPSGDGIVGWMRETGRALLVEDFATEMERLPARPRYQSERPPRSGIYVPLLVGESVIGSISIQSYQPGAFDTDDMRYLSLIADQAAVAIAKARAFDEARQRAVQLQAVQEVSERITAILDLDELLQSVVRLICERFGYQPVHIFLFDEDGALVFRASTAEGSELDRLRALRLREGDGVVGAAAREGHYVLVHDVGRDERYVAASPGTRSELAVPIRFGERRIGVLDVQSAEPDGFDKSDLFVMQTLADQIAVAVESAQAFSAQREQAWTLNALLQVAENLARDMGLDELVPAAVRLPPLLLGCDRCYYLALDRDQTGLVPLGAYGLTREQRAGFLGRVFPENAAPLLADARRGGAPVALEDAAGRHYLCPPILEPFGGQALLALPLRARGLVGGVLVLDYNQPRARFTQAELTLAIGVANQVASALESAWLAQEAAEASRLEEELRVAREIQTALLPAEVPDAPGWDIAAEWRSARIVGGDWYDYWWLNRNAERGTRNAEPAVPPPKPDDASEESSAFSVQPSALHLGFVIADVSDKGVPAAMFMALSRSLMRAAALDGSTPATAIARANRWITRDSESGMFVTLFYGVLQPESGQLRYACAGHNPPLLFRAADGSVQQLTTPGIALGVLEEVTIGEAEVRLEPGDILVCYTDGVTEAIDEAEEEFGVERLTATVLAHRHEGARAVLDAIVAALSQFTRGALFDDATLVIVKRDAPGD
ncbi:MAG TPA: SpoIIE family protein phosphatase [Roseiflexaceae bacterium]|nr:SpoIIE family protein phosphatase [Roseiflexaceae bacterium]